MNLHKKIQYLYFDRANAYALKNIDNSWVVTKLVDHKELPDWSINGKVIREFDFGFLVDEYPKTTVIVDKSGVCIKDTGVFYGISSTNIYKNLFAGYVMDANEVDTFIIEDLVESQILYSTDKGGLSAYWFKDNLYFKDSKGFEIKKINAETYHEVWSYYFHDLGILPNDFKLAKKRMYSIIYSKSKLYFAFDGAIGCLDADTGEQLWLHEFDNVRMFIQDVGDYIFVPLGGSFYYLDKKTGKQTDEQKWIPEYRVGTIEDGDKYERWSFSNKSLYHQGFIYSIITDRRAKQKLLKADGGTGEHISLLDLPKFGYENTFEIFDDRIYIHTSNNELLIIDPLKDFGSTRDK